MHPYEGEYQVFVLEEAERMRAEAANCLLKTLEEPSPHTVIILITTSPSALLPTILSRCRKIRLSALSREAVVEFLKSKGLGEKEAAEVAAFSGGRIDHLEEVLSGGFLAARREFVGLLRKIREEGDLGGLAFANTFRDREKAVEMLWWFARLARNALVSRMRKTEGEATDEAMDLFGPLNDAELIALFEKSADACQSIRGNANIELVLGSLLTDYAGGQR
jgi:DNA polymerase-3 subunit delta'